MNKISIICSNYNSSLWIDEYLQFVNYQTSNGFDMIFVDLTKDTPYFIRKNIYEIIDYNLDSEAELSD